MNNNNSFTLIELLIVIGILAVLGAVVILVINPTEHLARTRDSRRLSELQDLNKALLMYQISGGSSMGSSSVVYVSIPDSSPTCVNLGLPSLPSNWSYSCSSSTDYRKVGGNGWVPVNFTSISYGSPLPILPIDPINDVDNYYIYVTGGSFELNTWFESSRYRQGGDEDKVDRAKDGGDNDFLYEKGTKLTLSPFNDAGLVGYWKLNEGSGTTASDSSGNGNTGTLTNGPTWTSGKLGGALSFDGVDDYVDAGNLNLDWTNINFTAEAWASLNAGTPNNYRGIVGNRFGAGGANWWTLGTPSANIIAVEYTTGGLIQTNFAPVGAGWNHYVVVKEGTTIKIYINGVFNTSGSIGATNIGGITNEFRVGIWYAYSQIWNGLIDEVRIYNRALSAAEIAAIYNATK